MTLQTIILLVTVALLLFQSEQPADSYVGKKLLSSALSTLGNGAQTFIPVWFNESSYKDSSGYLSLGRLLLQLVFRLVLNGLQSQLECLGPFPCVDKPACSFIFMTPAERTGVCVCVRLCGLSSSLFRYFGDDLPYLNVTSERSPLSTTCWRALPLGVGELMSSLHHPSGDRS